ncbi:HNH endonuclease [Microbacterium sp. KSW4-17]|uniref:HNH endonuclease n=1 Tax=Microbacterium galbum TaxID=3075994 RepID=A0ABU3T6I1_9MICO|nr:HNH endonuclease [Microbacterium sp. KSW4-17]MDU0366984.1 HNH endonuclease [Microbacterium sp. KSW4-17]
MLSLHGGSLQRREALDEMDEKWRNSWTADDLSTPPSRPFELKWRNRTSFERQRMVEDGLLVHRNDGTWELTPAGWAELDETRAQRQAVVDREQERRERLWSQLVRAGGPAEIPADLVRATGMYRGYRGVFADLEVTRSEAFPSGIALTVLDLGGRYANERAADGILYRFPATETPGRDRSEIASIRAAYEAGVTVFVMTTGAGGSRTVHRSFVEDMDYASGLALLTFSGRSRTAIPPPPDAPFSLVEETPAEAVWARRRARPNQARFAFSVLKRYGTRCAVCDLSVAVAIQAAHLRSKARGGRDDPRNGLPLCANHHAMFDRNLWSITPVGGIVTGEIRSQTLGITRTDLSHLPAQPHEDALSDTWQQWAKAHPTGSAQ